MGSFMDTINWCSLRDIGFVGPRFTWLYQNVDGSQIREILDTTTKCIFSDEKIRHYKSSFSSLRTFSDEIGFLVTKLISSLKPHH